MGRCRDSMDCIGGGWYLAGTGGGGLGGGDSGRALCVAAVATVLQLKRLFGFSCTGGKVEACLGCLDAIVSIDCRPGATEGAYVDQLKWLLFRCVSSSLSSIIRSPMSLVCEGLCGGETDGG